MIFVQSLQGYFVMKYLIETQMRYFHNKFGPTGSRTILGRTSMKMFEAFKATPLVMG